MNLIVPAYASSLSPELTLRFAQWTALSLALSGLTSAGAQAPQAMRGVVSLELGGESEARDQYQFVIISGLYLDQNGLMYVADSRTDDVRVFGPDGTLRTKFGRTGEGPGDFRAPAFMGVDASGRMWVRDDPNTRYHAFDLRGDRPRPAGMIRMPGVSRAPASRAEWSADRKLIHAVYAGFPEPTLTVFALDESGTVSRRYQVPAAPSGEVAKVRGRNGTLVTVGEPFGGRPLRAVGGKGQSLVAFSSTYRVDWYDARGHRLRTLSRAVNGPPVAAAERDEAERALADQARRIGVARGAIKLDVPKHKPALKNLGFDLDGRVWVQMSTPAGQENVADVYDATGKRVAEMRWPEKVELYQWAARGNAALGVATAESGLSSVVRLTFTPIRSGQ